MLLLFTFFILLLLKFKHSPALFVRGREGKETLTGGAGGRRVVPHNQVLALCTSKQTTGSTNERATFGP